MTFVLTFGFLSTVFAQEEEVNAFYWADTVTVEAIKDLQMPTLNAIATKMILPLHKTPASVGVVTKAMFESQNAITVSDAIQNISGVNVQNGVGTHDFFLIRGFESLSGGLTLTDGAAEPEVSFYNLYNINRVEVLKGPSAFLYGGNPLSGAVNLSRKQPLFSNFATLTGSYGEFNTFNGAVDLGYHQEDGNLAFRLTGLWRETENFRDDKEQSAYAINPAITWEIDEASSVTANFEYARSNASPDAGLPLVYNASLQPTAPNAPRTRSYQTPLDYSEQDLYRLRIDYKRELSEQFEIRDKFYFTQLDWLSAGAFFNGAFPGAQGTTVIRTLNALDDSQNFFGNQLEAHFKYRLSSMKSNLIAGFELNRFSDKFDLELATFSPPSDQNPAGSNLVLAINYDNPQEFISSKDDLNFIDYAVGNAKSLILAPYFINQTEVTEQLQVFLGGRFDIIDYDDDRSDFNFNTYQTTAQKVSRNYEQFSPMAGLVFSPLSAVSLYANFGRSFRAPSTLVVGDPQPEESGQIEFGAKYSGFGGKLNGTVAVYQLERKNIGIPDQTGLTKQNGDQRSRGFELEISAQPGKGLNTFLTYTYTDAELTNFTEFQQGQNLILDRSGNTPAFAPKSMFNLRANKDFSGNFGVSAGLLYVGEQFIAPDNVFKIDNYITFDASLYFTHRGFRWSVNMKNIGDQKYWRRGGVGSQSVLPGNPRAVYGSMSYSL